MKTTFRTMLVCAAMLLILSAAVGQPIENTTGGDLQETHRPPTQPGKDDGSTQRTAPRRPTGTASTASAPVLESSTTTTTTTMNPTPPASAMRASPTTTTLNNNPCVEPSRKANRELSIFFGEGMSALYYDIEGGGDSKMRTGLNFGATYTYFMHENVSVLFGLGLSFYNTTAVLPTLYQFIGPANVLNDPLYIERYLSGYTEQQNIMTLNVPLMISYVSDYKFYIRGGIQLAVPLRSVYTATNANILQGYRFYLPSGNLSTLIYDPLLASTILKIEAGNYRMAPKATDYIDINLSLLLSIEAGIRLTIYPKHTLYVGGFFDFGINNAIVKRDNDFIKGEPKELENNLLKEFTEGFSLNNFTTNSLLNSRSLSTVKSIDDNKYMVSPGKDQVLTRSSFVNATHLMAFGIKLTYAFNMTPTAATSSVGDAGEPLSPWANISEKLDKLMANNSGSTTRIEKETTRIEREKAQPAGGKKTVKKTTKKVTAKTKSNMSKTVKEPLRGYAPRQTNLTAEQKTKLNAKASALRQQPSKKVTVIGHTSDVGGDAMNIGMQRAQAVKNYLMQKGVNSSQVSTVSRGAEAPVAPNNNAENRARNNRVEFAEK